MSKTYSSEDAQEILQRAIALQNDHTFSEMQLQEMAAETGVSAEVLQRAEQEWSVEKAQRAQSQQIQTRRRLAFRAHLIPYLVVSTFLVLLNLTTSPRYFWSIYPLLGWGLGVALQGASLNREKSTQNTFLTCKDRYSKHQGIV